MKWSWFLNKKISQKYTCVQWVLSLTTHNSLENNSFTTSKSLLWCPAHSNFYPDEIEIQNVLKNVESPSKSYLTKLASLETKPSLELAFIVSDIMIFLNYTKLTAFLTMVLKDQNTDQIRSEKRLPPVKIESKTSNDPQSCLPHWPLVVSKMTGWCGVWKENVSSEIFCLVDK